MVYLFTVKYLAYGSNVNLPHLRTYVESYGVDPDEITDERPVRLQGYRLRTNFFSNAHGAGACNIEPDNSSCLEGVLMSITPAVRQILRIKEGYPHVYQETNLPVRFVRTKRTTQVLTFTVTPACRLELDLPVTARYRQLILVGARDFGFSAAYQRELRRRLKVVAAREIQHALELG